MPHSLLFEIGVEELPSSYVDSALAALPALVAATLAQLRIAHSAVHVYGTPRRLAVYVENVAERQSDLDVEVVGPPEAAAFKDGVATRAAEAFAQKTGITVADLAIREFVADGKQKAGRFVVGRKREAGTAAAGLLATELGALIGKIPFRKAMRWGSGDATFGRPVQWLVALLGQDVLQVEWNGLQAGRKSRGHRFLAPQEIELADASEYVSKLRAGRVIAARDERTQAMLALVANAAKAHGADYDRAQLLVDENCSLVELPLLVEGSFDPKFLRLPPAVIRAVARGHQRYFCLELQNGDLLSKYLAIVNTAEDPARIAKGMNRVMAARLADAQFFFEEDLKTPFATFAKKLKGVVFHNRLGTVSEKTTRLTRLAAAVANQLGLPSEVTAECTRVAALCKLDLVSLMVGEFPELQGHMGRNYARAAGETASVADAIAGHYMPLGAADAIANTDLAAVVALADRLDTLVGCFAVGMSPSGSADPFALRRNCLAILRILIERAEVTPAFADLSLRSLLELAFDTLAQEFAENAEASAARKFDLTRDETVEKVLEFCAERLRGLLTNVTSPAVADAVLASRGVRDARVAAYPALAKTRALALHAAVESGASWLETARAVSKRLVGIAQGSPPIQAATLNAARPSDAQMLSAVERLRKTTDELATEAALNAALQAAEALATTLEIVFRETLVNDPADPHTQARLGLLSFAAERMLRIADFTRLAGAA